MSVATFDTLKFANTLKAAGMPPAQAEAQAAAFAEVLQVNLRDLVAKDDLGHAVKELKRDAADARDDLKQDIKDESTKVTTRIDRLEAKIDINAAKAEGAIAKLEGIVAKQAGDILLGKWMAGMGISLAIACLGLLVRQTFFPGR